MSRERAGEVLAAVDGNDVLVAGAARGCFPSGTFGRVVNAFVVNSGGRVWVPTRTAARRDFVGALDFSVGGYVRASETYREALERETFEETGLDVHDCAVVELAYLSPVHDAVAAFQWVYELRSDAVPASEDPGEWLSFTDLRDAARSDAAVKGDLEVVLERCLRGRT